MFYHGGHKKVSELSKQVFDSFTPEEKIQRFASGYSIPKKYTKEESFQHLRAKMAVQRKPEKQSRRIIYYWAAAASVLLIISFVSVFAVFAPTKVLTANGEHTAFDLPDGSEVFLNAGSKIKYAERSFKQKRVLKLQGEAFFLVQKGSPFLIKTSRGTVEILGTSLNVFSRDNRFEVSCLTGKVKVSSNGHSEIITPGERTALENGTLVKYSGEPVDNMATWRFGVYHFVQTPLISIFDELERQFDVKIYGTGFENRLFTGNFSNQKLNEILDTICLPMGLAYEIKDGNKVRIYKKTE
jgi:ferric-dicitrate binding protein FerR (iron transport regulator)